jgi:NitT/TauT family transport system permease protein
MASRNTTPAQLPRSRLTDVRCVVTALIIFFPAMINGVLGLRSVPSAALELMAIAEASRLDLLWRVRLPTALPYMSSGLQVARRPSG